MTLKHSPIEGKADSVIDEITLAAFSPVVTTITNSGHSLKKKSKSKGVTISKNLSEALSFNLITSFVVSDRAMPRESRIFYLDQIKSFLLSNTKIIFVIKK